MVRGRFVINVYGWDVTGFVPPYSTDRYPCVVLPQRSAKKGLSLL